MRSTVFISRRVIDLLEAQYSSWRHVPQSDNRRGECERDAQQVLW